jgi:hypothetical protein
MTLSNGTWLVSADLVFIASKAGSQGTLSIAGGTAMVSLDIGGPAATGTVWMTGGLLTGGAYIGGSGIGQMTMSNGTWQSSMSIGVGPGSQGTLTMTGGTNISSTAFRIGDQNGSVGTVWMMGGLLVVTNSFSDIGDSGIGQMTVSNGTWLTRSIVVAFSGSSQGRLTIAGGTNVTTNLIIGNTACQSTGIVTVVGGNLFVTNATHNAVLEVRSGTFTLSGGTVVVDQFVMTNSCASFVRTGGTLIYGSAVLDPNRDDDGDGISNGYEQSHSLDPLNPADAALDSDGDGLSNLQEFLAGTDATNSASSLRITSIAPVSTNLLITWQTGPGKTNALQRTAGDPGGGYSTNNFATIFTVTNTTGTVTNYLDVGAATNFPARYYRVRLVP